MEQITNYDRLMGLATFDDFMKELEAEAENADKWGERYRKARNDFALKWDVLPENIKVYSQIVTEVHKWYKTRSIKGLDRIREEVNRIELFAGDEQGVTVLPFRAAEVEWEHTPECRIKNGVAELAVTKRDCRPHLRNGRFLRVEIDLAAPKSRINKRISQLIEYYLKEPLVDVQGKYVDALSSRSSICSSYDLRCAGTDNLSADTPCPFRFDPWLVHHLCIVEGLGQVQVARDFLTHPETIDEAEGMADDTAESTYQGRVKRALKHARDIINQLRFELNLSPSDPA